MAKRFQSKRRGDTFAKRVGKEAKRKTAIAEKAEIQAEIDANKTEIASNNARIAAFQESADRQKYHEMRLLYLG